MGPSGKDLILRNVPYSLLDELSRLLIKYDGVHERFMASAGPMAMAVDAHCRFQSASAELLFKLEWPPLS